MGVSTYAKSGFAVDLGISEEPDSAYNVIIDQQNDEDWYEGKYPDIPDDWDLEFYGSDGYEGVLLVYLPSLHCAELWKPQKVEITCQITVEEIRAVRTYCQKSFGIENVDIAYRLWAWRI